MFPSSCLIYMLPYLLSEVEDRGSVRLWGAPPTPSLLLKLVMQGRDPHGITKRALCISAVP